MAEMAKAESLRLDLFYELPETDKDPLAAQTVEAIIKRQQGVRDAVRSMHKKHTAFLRRNSASRAENKSTKPGPEF